MRPRLNQGVQWIILLTMGIMMSAILALAFKPLILLEDSVEIEVGETFDPDAFLGYSLYAAPVAIENPVDVVQPGSYEVVYSLFAQTKKLTVEVKDTTPPVVQAQNVTRLWPSVVMVEDFIVGYTDHSEVRFSFLEKPDWHRGINPVYIKATDAYGNETIVMQEVTFIMIDTTAPSIEVDGRLEVEQGQSLKLGLPGLEIFDDCDPSLQLTTELDEHPIYELGDYEIQATLRDRSGNTTTTLIPIRVIPVQDHAHARYVYLTFDDGPSQHTQDVLRILDRYGVKASFFVTGMNPDYTSQIQSAYAQGHTIGLHTYSHQYSQIYQSVEAYFQDLEKIQTVVQEQTGAPSTFIRFPGGSSNIVSRHYHEGIMSQLANEVEAQGYQYFDWNSSVDDAVLGHDANDILVTGKAQTELQGDLMLLLHDGSGNQATVEVLEELIVYYLQQGYVFKAIDASTTPIHHQIFN